VWNHTALKKAVVAIPERLGSGISQRCDGRCHISTDIIRLDNAPRKDGVV